jgi:hypothetical protein
MYWMRTVWQHIVSHYVRERERERGWVLYMLLFRVLDLCTCGGVSILWQY